MRRWLLWLTIGALLLFEAGTVVTTRDGELLLPPGVLTGALLFWLFVTAAVLRRQFARTRRLRRQSWKLVFPRPGRDESEWLLSKTGAFIGERLEPVTALELYNLETDVGETSNVAGDHPDVVERGPPSPTGRGPSWATTTASAAACASSRGTEVAAPSAVDDAVTRGPASLRFLAGLDADLRQSLLNQLRDAWTHNSTALEGNSLSLGDTKFVIEEGLTVAGKPVKDHEEVIGHAAAITQIYDLLGRAVTADDLFALHRSVQAERVADIYKPLGAWKAEPNGTYAVDENGAQVFVEYAAPEHVPALMAEVLDRVNATRLRPDDPGRPHPPTPASTPASCPSTPSGTATAGSPACSPTSPC